MTVDNNLFYYEEEQQSLILWSMESQRIIHTEKIVSKVTKVFACSANKYYLIGYDTGKLEIRLATNLSLQLQFEGLGNIMDLSTDDEAFIVVSNKEGHLIHINLTDGSQSYL